MYKKISSIQDYTIQKIEMEYQIDHETEADNLEGFWVNESKSWDDSLDEYYVNITNINFRNVAVPSNVKRIIIRVKYWHTDKLYKYITRDVQFTWPPKRHEGMIFNMPIVSAHLIDDDGNEVRDVLQKVIRYKGPHGEFSGNEKIKITEMLYYDYNTLKMELPKIRLKNALGRIKTVSTVDGYIADLNVI
tara:strand:- start:251 stop:820 length:570 start_codon:yes stop_codon:yes gene_type:complete